MHGIPAMRADRRSTELRLEGPEGFLEEESQFLKDTEDGAKQ